MLQQTLNSRRESAEPALFYPRRLGTVAPGLRPSKLLFVARPAFLPHETEDTLLTGGMRSLNRRLLALNFETALARPQSMSQQLANPLSLSA